MTVKPYDDCSLIAFSPTSQGLSFFGPICSMHEQTHTTLASDEKKAITHFKVMRILHDNPDLTQRELADQLGMSVGGLNYCLKALINKGFVKMVNFQKSKNKFKYIYLLTPQGVAEKVALISRFFQRKMAEYDALMLEIDTLKAEVSTHSMKVAGLCSPSTPVIQQPYD